MKITFFGTSHGVPEAHRNCSCILVECAGKSYFVDMGMMAVDGLRRRGRPIEDVRAIFITHMHGDHTNGLIQFVDLITWYFKQCDPVIVLPDIEARRVINEWLKVTLNGNQKDIEYRQTGAGVVYDDGTLKVTAIPTRHCRNSFAYLLQAEGKSVLCTGDLHNPKEDFPAPGQGIDMLICESAHFPATDYIPVIEGMDIGKICFTHYSPRYMLSLYEMQKIMKEREIPMMIASDDLEIQL